MGKGKNGGRDFEPGHKKLGGRKKGSLNKRTALRLRSEQAQKGFEAIVSAYATASNTPCSVVEEMVSADLPPLQKATLQLALRSAEGDRGAFSSLQKIYADVSERHERLLFLESIQEQLASRMGGSVTGRDFFEAAVECVLNRTISGETLTWIGGAFRQTYDFLFPTPPAFTEKEGKAMIDAIIAAQRSVDPRQCNRFMSELQTNLEQKGLGELFSGDSDTDPNATDD